MKEKQKIDNLSQSISPYSSYCNGFGDNHSSGNGYILSIVLGVGKTVKKFGHEGSDMLDEINAFDLAEIDGPYIGQINMSIVSSFCGPQGMILGYDFWQPNNFFRIPARKSFPKKVHDKKHKKYLAVYEIESLVKVSQDLFGTSKNKRYIIKPGSHVPCAGKNIKAKGKSILYSSLAIGISKNREKDACLIMEDVGTIPVELIKTSKDLVEYEDLIRKNLARSVVQIGENQEVEFTEILVGVKSLKIAEDEIGCALVACPYITLPKKIFLKNSNNQLDFVKTISCNMIK